MRTALTTETRASETSEYDPRFHVLALDGGGTKGAYTLGALHVVEELLDVPLYEKFQLVYGTSTGAIIGSMVALGDAVETIWGRYQDLAPAIARRSTWVWSSRERRRRSARLRAFADEAYGAKRFDSFKTRIGIVTTKVKPHEEPMIFKSHEDQLLSNRPSFVPGFGSTITDAVVASCSAHPVFDEVQLDLGEFGERVLVDGGHMANNPTLLALVDTVKALRVRTERVGVLSLGTGEFPERRGLLFGIANLFPAFRRHMTLQNSSTRTMEWLNGILFEDIEPVRISDAHSSDDYRTSLLETDVKRLRELYSAGIEDAEKRISKLEELLGVHAPD